jgi:lipase
VRLHLHEWGDPTAPVLVCVHGVTSHGARFRRLAEERLGHRFRVVAPDLRGHGRSGYEPPWSLEQHLDDLLESVPAAGRRWVGHSFGGRLVLELAHRHADRVERGVLLDPALWVPPPYALNEAEAARADVSYASVDEAVDARYASGTVHGAPRELVEEDYREHLERGEDDRLRLRICRSAVIAAWGEMARTPPQSELPVPLRIVRARDSGYCPPELIAAYREVAGGRLDAVDVPGGHIVMWDALAATADAIEAFLAPAAA